MFKAFNRLAGVQRANQYPKVPNDQQVANDFVHFFKEKIDKITRNFDTFGPQSATSIGEQNSVPKMTDFKLLSQEEIEKYIMKSPSTTCALDLLPTDILKRCLVELLPVITLLINRSLSTGTIRLQTSLGNTHTEETQRGYRT